MKTTTTATIRFPAPGAAAALLLLRLLLLAAALLLFLAAGCGGKGTATNANPAAGDDAAASNPADADLSPDADAAEAPDVGAPGEDAGGESPDGGVDADAGSDGGGETPDAGEPDEDGDGFTVSQGDCDDHDPLVNPGRVDLPDLLGRDVNCDGRDGDATRDVYVDPSWTTEAIQAALDGCAAGTASCTLLFARGTYALTATLSIPAGAHLYGGYSADFASRDVSGTGTLDQSTVLLEGGPTRETILVSGQTAGTVSIDGMRIVGPTSPEESYAVRIYQSADVRLSHLHILGGRGADGAAAAAAAVGAAGGNAAQDVGGSGDNPGASGRNHLYDIQRYTGGCSGRGPSSRQGLNGSGPKPGLARPTANDPGITDQCLCAESWCWVGWTAGASNTLNWDGTLNASDHYQDGGAGDCGAGGAAAAPNHGSLGPEGRWHGGTAGGGAGNGGTAGSGGASGTLGGFWAGGYAFLNLCGSLPVEVVCIQTGGDSGGGGGGGSGGQGAAGGAEGQASVALMAVDSGVELTEVTVAIGTGGAGGRGGDGGNGGDGGFPGASKPRVTQTGCTYTLPGICDNLNWNKAAMSSWGGAGGPGGGGGGGAGGNGGPAIGVLAAGSAITADRLHLDTTTGAGGAAGAAGGSGSIPRTPYNEGGSTCPAAAPGVQGGTYDVLQL